MRFLALLICIVIVVPVFGQRKKKEDEEIILPVYMEGIAYTLPRTGVKVYVTALKETITAGPYNAYANQLLGISNAPSRNSVKWSIVQVKFNTFSEPNPEMAFKAMGEGAYLLNLTPDGRLAGINSGSKVSESVPIHTNQYINKPKTDDSFSFDYFTDTPFYTEGDSTNNFQPVRVSSEQKAAEAAQRVLDSRMHQFDMAACMMDDIHPDGDAYKVSMEELKKTERDYLSLFVGRKTYKKEQFVFDFIPTKSNGKGSVLFRISDEKGVVPATDLSGKPVLIEFEKENVLTKKYSDLAKSENPEAGKSGVFYQMPGLATIKIIYELQTIATSRTAIAQFGEIAPLPEDLLSGEYSVEIHPETGAIKSVSKK